MTVPPQGMRLAVLGSLLGSLALLGGVVWIGRLAGAFNVPLAWPWLIVTAVLLAGACCASRVIWLKNPVDPSPAWLDHLARWGPLAGCALLSSAILLPGTSFMDGMLFLAILAAEEGYACAWLPWPRRLDKSILQHVTRRRGADGRERLQGWLRLPLEPGQRTAVGHLAFCPPFDHTPQVTAEHLEGPEGRLRVEQALPFGTRVEVKLTRAASAPTHVVVRVTTKPAA